MVQLEDAADKLPPLAALFLVVFDQKAGYTIAWKRTIRDLDIEGAVEYKSLPSGLHNVQNDLVYFTHDDYAGLSYFLNKPASEAQRNANFVSVGVLVPLTYGRLGRTWMHADGLRRLAESALQSDKENRSLETYWESNRLSTPADDLKAGAMAEPSSPMGARVKDGRTRRSRAQSLVSGFGQESTLSPDHPALSMSAFLEIFGPLAFPVYRAALLRKRILLVGATPVQRMCEYVYDLSILSNVPPSLSDVLPTSNSLLRIRPLLNVGIHDIPALSNTYSDEQSREDHELSEEDGWLACTTDDILASKTGLWDLLIEMPSGEEDGVKKWPRVRQPDGTPVRATQRDMRRYKTLRRDIRRKRSSQKPTPRTSEDIPENEMNGHETDTQPLLGSGFLNDLSEEDLAHSIPGEAEIVEPSSWASIAYSSFLWWASSGEQDALIADEESQDAALVDDLALSPLTPRPASSKGKRSSTLSSKSSIEEDQALAMILIAYFHRLTTAMVETLAGLVASADDEADEGVAIDPIVIESDDIRHMGLDVWSQSDRDFLRDIVQLYFERQADVKTINVECCGIRIC